jgi:hypothetical protein
MTVLATDRAFAEFDRWRQPAGAVRHRSLGIRRALHLKCEDDLVRFGAYDGALVISGQGSEIIMYDAGLYVPSPGGRHQAARTAVDDLDWVQCAFVVSQDGPISVFRRGHQGRAGGDLHRYG